MRSPSSPRVSPRWLSDALRGRVVVWGGRVGLFLAIRLAVIVDGQFTRGDRGITPINSSGDFLASGILVDVTGDNADDACSKGWREAQRKGWAQLYRRLNGTDGPALGDSVLDGIVTSKIGRAHV